MQEGKHTHDRDRRHPPAAHVRAGDDVAAEVFLGPDPAGEINEWGAVDGHVVAVDGEHLDVRTNGRVVTVHRSFARRQPRRPHLRPTDVHGAGAAKGAGS